MNTHIHRRKRIPALEISRNGYFEGKITEIDRKKENGFSFNNYCSRDYHTQVGSNKRK